SGMDAEDLARVVRGCFNGAAPWGRGVGTTEPRHGGGGRTASTGPRPGGAEWVHGGLLVFEDLGSFNGAAPWGRGVGWCRSARPSRSARFNGAAPWGRGVGIEDGLPVPLQLASTGPRPG